MDEDGRVENDTMINAIVAYLTQEGYEVQAASNGEEALERKNRMSVTNPALGTKSS